MNPQTGYKQQIKSVSIATHIKGGLSGFTALIGGKRGMKGDFNYIGEYGNYWSSTDSVGGLAWFFLFDKANGKIISTHGSRRYAHSCRCVKD